MKLFPGVSRNVIISSCEKATLKIVVLFSVCLLRRHLNYTIEYICLEVYFM